MSGVCKPVEIHVVLSLVSPNELRCTDECSKTFVQKYITATNSEEAEHQFTYEELKDVGAMLHESKEFLSDRFKQKESIVALGLVLAFPQTMTREKLANAISTVTKFWFEMCTKSDECVLLPSRQEFGETNSRKRLFQMEQIQKDAQRQRYQLLMRLDAAKRSEEEKEFIRMYQKNYLTII